MASVIWSPTVRTGFSAFMAPWKTSERRVQRNARSEGPSSPTRSTPSNQTEPPTIFPPGGRRRMRPSTVVVLPQPDSPTSPSVSPRRRSKLTPSTARIGP